MNLPPTHPLWPEPRPGESFTATYLEHEERNGMNLPDDREQFYAIANKAGLTFKQAETMRAYALSYGRAVQQACVAEVERKRSDWMLVRWPGDLQDFGGRIFDSVAAAIRNGVIREGEGE